MKLILRFSFVLLIVSFATNLYANSKRQSFPHQELLFQSLNNDPLQTETTREPFMFEYRNRSYNIEPVAEYSLSGMVVSHNDITEFTDIYHDEDSVDIKDICVIWGKNLNEAFYRNAVFYSEPWTCYMKTESREVYSLFDKTQLSNSHLLSDNPEVREAVLNATRGDQIQLSGMLVNYAPTERPEWLRKTSTRRGDQGNGACEVIFVEHFQILEKANKHWHQAYEISATLSLFLLFFVPGMWLFNIYFGNWRRYRS